MPELQDFAEREAIDREKDATILRLQRDLKRAKERNERLVDEVYRAAQDAVVTASLRKPVAGPDQDRRRKAAEVALLHLTDWQACKVTASYNTDVMRQRVGEYIRKVERITAIQRADHPVKDAVVLFGGDLIEGLFQFPQQPFEIDETLFAQWSIVSRTITEVIREVLRIFERVTVAAEWGNHGRIGNKRAVVPRSDNVDRMCYETARQTLSDQPRLTWPDCPEDIQRVEVGNYRALVMHGDEVGRTGFASPTTMLAHCNRLRSGAYPWDFRDVYLGHYHVHLEMPLANGEGAIYYTGSTESDNRYARDTMASAAKPSQRLHFLDPIKGRVTAQYKVLLT